MLTGPVAAFEAGACFLEVRGSMPDLQPPRTSKCSSHENLTVISTERRAFPRGHGVPVTAYLTGLRPLPPVLPYNRDHGGIGEDKPLFLEGPSLLNSGLVTHLLDMAPDVPQAPPCSHSQSDSPFPLQSCLPLVPRPRERPGCLRGHACLNPQGHPAPS